MNLVFSKIYLVGALVLVKLSAFHSAAAAVALNDEKEATDNVLLRGRRELQGGPPSDIWENLPPQVQEKFKDRNTLKKNVKPKTQKVKNNRVKIGNDNVSLLDKDLDPVDDVFTPGATYTVNGESKDVPSAGVYRSKKNKSIMITKGANGEFLFASKAMSDGKTLDVLPVDEGSDVFATISSDDVDVDELNKKFQYGQADIFPIQGGGDRGLLRISNPEQDFFDTMDREDPSHRSLQACSSFEVIQVAIAYESFFCADFGNDSTSATNAAITTVAQASAFYQQAGLCKKVEISHLEGFCNNVNDPYQSIMQSGSVCGGSNTLLDRFRSYWANNRQSVSRDVAHLFHGKQFSTNIIGCAYLDVLCRNDAGYGVNFITYTSTTSRWPILFAHELGHNAGSNHDCSSCNFIMRPSICGTCTTFSSSSITQILDHIDDVYCIDPEGPTTPPTPATPSPTPTQPTPSSPPPTTTPVTPAPTTAPVTPPPTPNSASCGVLFDDCDSTPCCSGFYCYVPNNINLCVPNWFGN